MNESAWELPTLEKFGHQKNKILIKYIDLKNKKKF